MHVDPRGVRFSAWLTAIALAGVLLTHSAALLALQAAVFAVGAVGGMRVAPYGVLFRNFVAPRLGPPNELEDAAPPRFAQAVGLGFALVGLAAGLLGASVVAAVAVGLALAAAFLNAAFGFCLGCEMYLLLRRMRTAVAAG